MKHTIGIAAECVGVTDEGKKDSSKPGVILCTDRRIDFDYAASESGDKFFGLGKGGWGTVIAGSADKCLELIYTLAEQMSTALSEMPDTNGNALVRPFASAEALRRIRNAVKEQEEKWINEVLGRFWGISFDEFKTTAKDQFPEDTIKSINWQISNLSFDCEMLLARVSFGWPEIFCLTNGLVSLTTSPFATIGSGAILAHSALIQRGYQKQMPFDEAVYCVYEAKRMSEKNTGVGPETKIYIVRENLFQYVTDEGLDFLGEQYKKLSLQPLKHLSYPKRELQKIYGLS